MVWGGAASTAVATPVRLIVMGSGGMVVIFIEFVKIPAETGLKLMGKVQDPPNCPAEPGWSAPLKQEVRSPVENPFSFAVSLIFLSLIHISEPTRLGMISYT